MPFEPDQNYHGVSAALEFAVTQLEVDELVVMGHGFCGGCAAALTGQFDHAAHGAGHFIAHWIDMLVEARDPIRTRHPELGREAFFEMELEGGIRTQIHVSWLDPCKVRRITVVGSKKMAVYDDLAVDERIRVHDKGVHPDVDHEDYRT